MKGAQTAEPTPFANKLYPLTYQVGQRHPLTQIFDEFRWYGHSHSDRRLTSPKSGA